jgi:hypothetical protein
MITFKLEINISHEAGGIKFFTWSMWGWKKNFFFLKNTHCEIYQQLRSRGCLLLSHEEPGKAEGLWQWPGGWFTVSNMPTSSLTVKLQIFLTGPMQELGVLGNSLRPPRVKHYSHRELTLLWNFLHGVSVASCQWSVEWLWSGVMFFHIDRQPLT